MNQTNLFRGTGVAMITPFEENDKVDFHALERTIKHIIDGNVEYIVLLGTTGESATLGNTEKNAIIDFAIKKINGRVPVVAGFGGNNTRAVAESIAQRSFDGIDAILSVSPYYNKPTQEGIFEHYTTIANQSPVPVILYNVPSRTASNIEAATTLRLAQHPNIIGIKEASGNFAQIMDILNQKPDDFLVISGDDATALPLVSLGASGVISVIANAYPAEFSDLVRNTLEGNYMDARAIQYSLLELMKLIFEEGNPAGVKALMQQLGICEPFVRLPLVQASASLKEKIKHQMTLAL